MNTLHTSVKCSCFHRRQTQRGLAWRWKVITDSFSKFLSIFSVWKRFKSWTFNHLNSLESFLLIFINMYSLWNTVQPKLSYSSNLTFVHWNRLKLSSHPYSLVTVFLYKQSQKVKVDLNFTSRKLTRRMLHIAGNIRGICAVLRHSHSSDEYLFYRGEPTSTREYFTLRLKGEPGVYSPCISVHVALYRKFNY